MARTDPHHGACARVHAQWGRAVFVLLVFRGPCRALQDLYGDWSAIYRNRIPPYLTLLLATSLPRFASAASGDSVFSFISFLFPSSFFSHSSTRCSFARPLLFFFTKPLFSSLLFNRSRCYLFLSSSTFSSSPPLPFFVPFP